MRIDHVADWMSTPPILVRPTATLADARQIMRHRQVRRLPVVEEGRLVGIVTWCDLRAAQPSSATPLSTHEWHALLDRATVAECMTREPASIAPDATVFEAVQRLLDLHIAGLPVVDHGRVVGVITASDLLRLLVAQAMQVEDHDQERAVMICRHCGAQLRRRSFEGLGPDDLCWRCGHHIHSCENCRYFEHGDCIIERIECHEHIPGQHCPAFAYLPMRAIMEHPLAARVIER